MFVIKDILICIYRKNSIKQMTFPCVCLIEGVGLIRVCKIVQMSQPVQQFYCCIYDGFQSLSSIFRYDYGCVIYGWDPVCKMPESWIQQMGVDNSPGGRSQPFYNVLADDGSQRYAAHSKCP